MWNIPTHLILTCAHTARQLYIEPVPLAHPLSTPSFRATLLSNHFPFATTIVLHPSPADFIDVFVQALQHTYTFPPTRRAFSWQSSRGHLDLLFSFEQDIQCHITLTNAPESGGHGVTTCLQLDRKICQSFIKQARKVFQCPTAYIESDEFWGDDLDGWKAPAGDLWTEKTKQPTSQADLVDDWED